VYDYGIGLFSTGKTKEAVSLLENYLARYGNNPQILECLISILQDTNQVDKANHFMEIRKKVVGY
jgi:predicted Zn-dependent protease